MVKPMNGGQPKACFIRCGCGAKVRCSRKQAQFVKRVVCGRCIAKEALRQHHEQERVREQLEREAKVG
jgi:hypothetical protein